MTEISRSYDTTMIDGFGDDFTWGTATSAYQIEGGRFEGGKGDSIWDRFADDGNMPENGDVACDHFHRWRQDVRLMADLGVNAYRFSIAWTRVVPDGDGAVNEEGLTFYNKLVDELVANGITPYPTLYHWDLPQALQERGGWANRATVDAFARYADIVSASLGDRVRNWITHNEPWVATFLGHVEGVFAPGVKHWPTALAAAHHILVSHGRAVMAIRVNRADASVGIALDCRPSFPASDVPADLAAQRHFDGYRNRWFFDPVFGRGYPDDMLDAYLTAGRIDNVVPSFIEDGDLETIATPIDFLGLNYYTSIGISAGGEESESTGVAPGTNPPDGYTEMGWAITPVALTAFLRRLVAEYDPARILITENGASYSTGPDEAGRVHDAARIAYLEDHIAAVAVARADGVPVEGYFVWSLLDNLEWVAGYSQRFGIIWVDHATGRRIPKDSYRWYRALLAGLPRLPGRAGSNPARRPPDDNRSGPTA